MSDLHAVCRDGSHPVPTSERIAMKFRILLLSLLPLLVTACASKDGDSSRPDGQTAASEIEAEHRRRDPMRNADPQMQAVMRELASLSGEPIEKLSPQEARQQPTPADAVKALLREQGKPTTPELVGNVE